MIPRQQLHALHSAFDERAQAGQPVQLWLRDDDAIEPSEPLDQLLELTHRYSIPLTLAVIPAHTGRALVERLCDTEQVSIAVHGWSHRNHAPATEKKQESGAHRELKSVLAELEDGLFQLSALHTTRVVPLLVPPWNRIDTNVVASLTKIGFQALSTFGAASPAPIKILNTHLDIIDWKGSRGGRDSGILFEELTSLVQEGTQPIGILTHHLVHDKQAWHFLDELFAATCERIDVSWMPVDRLV